MAYYYVVAILVQVLRISATAAAETVLAVTDNSTMTFASTVASQPLLTVNTAVPNILPSVSAIPPPASVIRAVAHCYSDEFLCRKENRCVPHLVVCNGVQECQDGSDEANCTDCLPNFRCWSGACVPSGLVCDGVEDCSDGSDERDCSQSVCHAAGMFKCVTGYCLENDNRCDGVGDCFVMGLPVDELNCIETDNTCTSPNQFTCHQSLRCIPLHWRCNGRIDCLSHEDEINCQCDAGKFSCKGGGGCIDARLRCNGVADCPDGYSDEKDCFQLQHSGLVQARMLDTEWHTLCTHGWNLRAANNICQQLGYRPAVAVFALPAPATETGNTFSLKPDFNATLPLLQQLHISSPDTCSDPNSRAGITCEDFRCQIASDPGVGNQVNLQSAIVKITFDGDAFTVCNGHLVAPIWILTSASCLMQNRPASTIKLTFYANSFRTSVSAVFFHPNHLTVRMLHNYDFALLKLASVVPANLVPICLPSSAIPSLCKLVKLYDNNTVVASQLQRAADIDCNSRRNFVGLVSGSMECWRSSLSVCDEDAVSPMICQSTLGAWEIRGFLSYQHKCGNFSPKPLVFANLTYAVDWMRDLIGPALSTVARTNESVFYPDKEPFSFESHTAVDTTAHELPTTSTPLATTATTTVASIAPVHFGLEEVSAENGNASYNFIMRRPVGLSKSTAAGFAAVLFNVVGNITGVALNKTVATMLVPDTTTSPTPFKLQRPDARGNRQFDLTNLDPSVAYRTAPNEHRQIVVLMYLKGDLEKCIGVLLNSRWILTSYECVSQADLTMSPRDWALFSDPNSMDRSSFHMIRRFVPHPSVRFNIYFSKHDLVLVEAVESLIMGSNNAAVWMPMSPVALNASCVTYGYLHSRTEIPGTRMTKRSEGQLYFWKTPLISTEQCNQAGSYNGLIPDSMVCGGFRNITHRGPCMGRVDGAPVICRNAEQLWEVVGIRSFQPVCDSLWMAPSVYTDIFQHRQWISDVIGP
ncbi:uncharacterized protein LOC129588728 isoform X2 [Paramacrobiotus metropolitanus]|nr:uncharacterized protein LOC129588728 isoform X2 [Paramacrobiotus metropolitanus]XP_055339065.1 uncharacterized protein LOC129588728 isoform X2 [Paramacrobiotus metropolitanus]XP_055339066.1 uncharacterized protein LOC129588728 isoform X2 [Paramacrobiotus metropolitanus]